MIKHAKGWELSSKIDHKHRIYVRSFSGAKVRSMKDYVKPCIRDKNPDHIIMHIGTNDLDCKSNPEGVAKSIVDLAEVWFLRKGMLQFLESHPEMTNGAKRKKK